MNSPDAVPAGRDGDAGPDPGRLPPLLPGGEPVEGLLRRAQFFVPGEPSGDFREVHREGGRGAEEFYRERWRHDKVVRSTIPIRETPKEHIMANRHPSPLPPDPAEKEDITQPSRDLSPLPPDPAEKEDIMRPSPLNQASGDSQAAPGERRPRG